MKKSGGQSTISGVNAQAWAAMSLFLQYVERTDFSYIGFEGEKLEDFHLVFANGKKMICESKDQNLNYAEVRDIIEKIYTHGQVNPQNEIVIICKSVNHKLKSDFENYKYFGEEVAKRLTSSTHNFKKYHLQYIPQIKFWEVPQDMNERIVKIILSRLLTVWVPERRLEEIKDHIVLQEVFHGSAAGKILTKDDFIKKLDAKKIEILEDAGYETERKTAEQDVKELLKLVETKSDVRIVPSKISDISRNPSEFFFLIMKLKDRNDLNLVQWDSIWDAAIHGFLSIHLFDVFKNNLQTEENQRYAIEFAGKVLNGGYNLFREEFIKTDIADLCRSIFEKNPSFERKVFEIVVNLFKPDVSDFFYKEKIYRSDRHSWEREKFSELIKDLYQHTKDSGLKEEIIKYLSDTFNLVEDNGEYWHYTPPSIFTIFKEDLLSAKNLQEKIIWFKNLCISHYDNFHRRFDTKWKFDGWELSGSGISQSGSEFSIGDNHFVSSVLKPALEKLYKNNESGWKFIVDNCIARNIEDVSRENPDFLNRASLPILFSEYKNGVHKEDAFEILSDFVRMRRGIPWKGDLIFQELRGDYSDEQKWNLVKVSLDEFKNLPVNIFVEQIVSDLAEREHAEAITAMSSWINNPEYNQRQTIGSNNIMNNISKLLNNPKTFDTGVSLYKNYITSKDFIEKNNDWGTWDVAKVLANIISLNAEVGIALLNELVLSKKLTQNQQTLIASGLNDLPKENSALLKKVYELFVDPFFKKLNYDIAQIEQTITNRYSREQIVQFADKLGDAGLWEEAFLLMELFVDDSDPILESYPDDKKGEFNEHTKVIKGEDSFAIRTVRGWCAWVLQKLVLPRDPKRINETRKIIEKSLPIVRKLATDQNYYVRMQATIPLMELAKNKNTVLPKNKKERFISIEIAKEISDIAFLMLRDPINQKLPAVMKHLAMVFSYMRSISQVEAMEVLQTFLKDNYPDKKKEKGRDSYLADVLSDAAPLYIFFAEFRKDSFKEWPRKWGDLGIFDGKPFKELLESLLQDDNPEIRRIFTWQIARLPNEVKDRPEFKSILEVSARYLKLATNKYDHHTFENIYRFIEDYIFDDNYFEVCFDLWNACIQTEAKFLKENYSKDKLHEMHWWPFHYNGKILVRILNVKGESEFLDWLGVLLNYHEDFLIAYDLDIAIDELVKVKGNKTKIEDLFAKLINRNPKYFEYKQRWKSD